ncbi:MAG: NUDIX hydrolase, partial [Chloroflexia bacterium]
MSHDKPVGESAGWHRVETTHPFVTPWLVLRQDRVQIENGPEIEYVYRVSKGAVLIVPVTHDGNMVLIKQYRYAVDTWCLEVPAGGMHDREGAPPETVALEELHEEAGATCENLILISSTYSNNSTTDELMHTYLATGVELHGYVQHEATEQIEVVTLPIAQAIQMARTGEMKDALSALAILQCEPR